MPSQAQTWYAGPDWRPQASPLSREMLLTGLWPDSCAPVLERAWQEDGELRVHTRSPVGGCAPSASRFELALGVRLAELTADRVSWWHASGAGEGWRLHGFRLLAARGVEGRNVNPDSGWWWPEPGGQFDAGGPGSGLTVDHQSGFITLVTQAYDEGGRPEWLVASGSLRQGRISAPLVRFHGGGTLTGAWQAPDVTPTPWSLSLQFHSASTATAWYSRRLGGSLADPVELRSISMVRYLMDPPVLEKLLLGRWLVVLPESDEAPALGKLNIAAIQAGDGQPSLLLDADGNMIGQCEAHAGRSESPPASCELQAPGGTADSALLLDNFGFDRISGKSAAGQQVILFRLP